MPICYVVIPRDFKKSYVCVANKKKLAITKTESIHTTRRLLVTRGNFLQGVRDIFANIATAAAFPTIPGKPPGRGEGCDPPPGSKDLTFFFFFIHCVVLVRIFTTRFVYRAGDK